MLSLYLHFLKVPCMFLNTLEELSVNRLLQSFVLVGIF